MVRSCVQYLSIVELCDLRIQSVLCVNEDDFPSSVAILAWELSCDWTT